MVDVDPAVCPVEVQRPVMQHRWDWLTFLHWAYPVETVQRLLPRGLTVDTFGGVAYVGLIPFFMTVALPSGRRLPVAGRFCETNVRTYVRDENGQPGIWFFSLDATSAAAVTTARMTYRLPYCWSTMSLQRRDDVVRYDCRRRWPEPASSHAVIRVGEPYAPGELEMRDHFLTARWVLFSRTRRFHRLGRASHAPWPLYRAEVLELDDGLIAADGLPSPEGPPLALYSPGVTVKIGRPERS